MEKEQIALKMLEKIDSSKSRESRNQGRMNRLVSGILLVAGVLVVLGALPVKVRALVQFDGRKCYLSEKTESLQITDEGYLQWSAPGPQQLIVQLDEKLL
jgi:hypothetical protein